MNAALAIYLACVVNAYDMKPSLIPADVNAQRAFAQCSEKGKAVPNLDAVKRQIRPQLIRGEYKLIEVKKHS